MTIDSLEMLFQEELKDVYDAELHLTKALPKMVKAAKAEELKTALSDHLEVTKTQVGRLEEIFAALGVKPVSKPCLAIKGLLAEGEEAMKSEGPGPLTDLSLIGAARRVEHYEMAAYLSLQDLAENLDNPSILELLASSLP